MQILAILITLTTSLMAQDDTKANEFGANLGWGNPFGASVQYSHALTQNQSAGVGVGFSMSGARCGLDYKYFFNSENTFNPYIGLSGSYVTGLSGVNVNVNSDSAKYDFKGGVQITPRGGLRYQAGFANFYMNAGYGIPVVGGGVEYISGSEKSSIKSLAEAFALGGLEISVSAMLLF